MELPEQLEEFAELSKSDLESTTSRELRNKVKAVEDFLIDHVGKVDYGELWDIDEGVADQVFSVQDILKERMKAANRYIVSEHDDRLDDIHERTTGMQKAIDDLKEHTHEKLDTGLPKRDF